ncbi:MAG: ankyrin repeat domain-containing protein [Candidatus Amoebophilus sp.]
MFPKELSIERPLFVFFKLLIGLLIFSGIISCGCGNSREHNKTKKGESSQDISSNNQALDGCLNMEVFPIKLDGNNKQVTATFILTDNDKVVDLTQYKLRVKLVERGSTINYKDGSNTLRIITDKVEENLTHFFSIVELKPNEAPLELTFNIVPSIEATSVNIVFELFDKDNAKLKQYPISWNKEVVRSVGLKINKLAYEQANSRVVCSIQNNSKEVVKDIQLRYTNISQDAIGKNVVLNNQQAGVINFTSIAPQGLTEDQILPIDFKSAIKATFRFEVLYQGKVVENATEEKEFDYEEALLKLVAVGPTSLIGKDKAIQLRIKKEAGSGNIDASKLELRIIQHVISDAYLDYNGKASISVPGSELNVIGNNISLVIQSSTAVQASFELHLVYAQRVLDKQTFTWRMDGEQANKMLLETAAAGNEKKIEKLLQIPEIDINIKNENDETPLHEAAKSNNSAVIKLLLGQENIQVNAQDKQEYTPLSIAIEQSNTASISSLLQSTKTDVNIKNKWGSSPLHLAIQKDNKGLVEDLIAKGVNVNATDNHDISPLHIATLVGSTKVIALLLAEGANINAMDEDGNTPLHIAAEEGKESVIELLLTMRADVKMIDKRGLTPLHKAALASNKLAIQALLARKAEVNAEDMHGTTPLHKAAEKGDKEAIEALLAVKEVKLYAKDNDGNTPLHISVLKGNEKAVTALLDKGVKVNVKDKYNNMPLHIAAQKGNMSIIKKLLKKREGINAKDAMGYTPLHMAIYYDHPAIVELLLKKQARRDIKDAQGETVVDLVQRSTNEEIKRLFAKNREGLNDKDSMGYTPATYHDHPAIDKLLPKKQAERNIKDEQEETEVDLVWRSINEEMEGLFAVTNP